MQPNEQARPFSGKRGMPLILAGALLGIFITLCVRWPLMVYSACSAWLLALIALCMTIVWSFRVFRSMRGASPTPSRKRTLGVLAVSTLMFMACTFVLLIVNATGIRGVQSIVSSAHLKSLSVAIAIYLKEHDEYPNSLDVLVEEGHISRSNLIAPYDTTIPFPPADDVRYSSYEYTPLEPGMKATGEHIIAYEREAMAPLESTIFRPYGRWVLFADWHVELHGEEGFQAVLARDRMLRRRGEPVGTSATMALP